MGMWKSRDVAFIIVIPVINFVFCSLVGQLGWAISGLPGSNLVIFGIIYAIFPSFSLLIFKGRRWMFLVQSLLAVMISIPTYVNGIPFDLISRIPVLVSAVQCDIVFNSIYGFFEKRNKLLWWAILASIEFTVITPVIGLLVWPLVLAPETIALWKSALPLIYPVIIAETTAGAYLGHKIYRKVEKLDQPTD
jgi:hypothetical protein